MKTNFERMIALADQVFASRQDPAQLDVNDEVLERLQRMHPAAVSEWDDGQGPVAWVLLIPTTSALMEDFLCGRITERELFDRTPEGIRYDALYLCSALVLEEYRRQGIAGRLTMDALARIRLEHPIRTLFVWTFSPEGKAAAEALAHRTGLPLRSRIASAAPDEGNQ